MVAMGMESTLLTACGNAQEHTSREAAKRRSGTALRLNHCDALNKPNKSLSRLAARAIGNDPRVKCEM